MRRVRVHDMTLAVILTLATLGVPLAAPRRAAAAATPPQVVIFVLDLSGSMNEPFGGGQSKIDVAKAAFKEAFSRVSDSTVIGLRVYGDQFPPQSPASRQRNCEKDTRLLVPPKAGNRDNMLRAVQGLTARGDTPISLALQAANNDVPAGALATIVLFSDGRDECFDADLNGNPAVGPSWGPDPCVVAKQLANKGTDLRIDKVETLGFGTDQPSADQLRCIAESTGGTFHPIATPSDAQKILPSLLLQLGSPRAAVRLGGTPIRGTPASSGAPELRRIAASETSGRYTDTITIGQERWYHVKQYGPGAGDTTATVFDLPTVPGITLEIRLEPGPGENISGNLVETHSDAGNPPAPSASVRCPGCSISGAAHNVYFVVALRSTNPAASGTYDLELLLEGAAWGGAPATCAEKSACWYQAKIDEAKQRLGVLQAQFGGASPQEVAALTTEVSRLTDQQQKLTTKEAALQKEGRRGGGTNWLIPIVLSVVLLASLVWLLLVRGRVPSRAESPPPRPVAVGAPSEQRAVIGTLESPSSESAVPSPTEVVSIPGPEGGTIMDTDTLITQSPGASTPHTQESVEALEVPEFEVGSGSGAAPSQQPAPGWYEDPYDAQTLRWWDGSAWSSHTQDRS